MEAVVGNPVVIAPKQDGGAKQETSKKTITVSVSGAVGIVIFLLTIGAGFGGYKALERDVNDVKTKLDNVSQRLDVLTGEVHGIQNEMHGIHGDVQLLLSRAVTTAPGQLKTR